MISFFLIFDFKLGHFKVQAIFSLLQTLKLNRDKQKKSSFYKEKHLVGLTSGENGICKSNVGVGEEEDSSEIKGFIRPSDGVDDEKKMKRNPKKIDQYLSIENKTQSKVFFK